VVVEVVVLLCKALKDMRAYDSSETRLKGVPRYMFVCAPIAALDDHDSDLGE